MIKRTVKDTNEKRFAVIKGELVIGFFKDENSAQQKAEIVSEKNRCCDVYVAKMMRKVFTETTF